MQKVENGDLNWIIPGECALGHVSVGHVTHVLHVAVHCNGSGMCM